MQHIGHNESLIIKSRGADHTATTMFNNDTLAIVGVNKKTGDMLLLNYDGPGASGQITPEQFVRFEEFFRLKGDKQAWVVGCDTDESRKRQKQFSDVLKSWDIPVVTPPAECRKPLAEGEQYELIADAKTKEVTTATVVGPATQQLYQYSPFGDYKPSHPSNESHIERVSAFVQSLGLAAPVLQEEYIAIPQEINQHVSTLDTIYHIIFAALPEKGEDITKLKDAITKNNIAQCKSTLGAVNDPKRYARALLKVEALLEDLHASVHAFQAIDRRYSGEHTRAMHVLEGGLRMLYDRLDYIAQEENIPELQQAAENGKHKMLSARRGVAK